MRRDEPGSGVVVVQEAEDERFRIMAASVAGGECVHHAAADRRLPVEDFGPGPHTQLVGPVICGVESIVEVERIAGAGFGDQQPVRFDSLELGAEFRPELRTTLLDTPGDV
jgi:hypothetical protein